MNGRLRTWCLGLGLAVGWSGASALALDPDSTWLAPGVVVDSGRELAYVTAPDGHAQAIVLADGRVSWISHERALPLGMHRGQLIALAVTEQFGLGMVVLLDPATGNALDRVAFDLPEMVSADVLPAPQRRFVATLGATEDALRLYWRYEARPLRGAMLEAAAGTDGLVVQRGAVDLQFAGDRTYASTVRSAVEWPQLASPELTVSERLPGVGGSQFRAADAGHVLASSARSDAVLGWVNRWQIHDRTSGKLLGELDSPYALAPFVVRGDTLFYRALLSAQQGSDGRLVEQPTRLVAFDLRHSQPLWSVAVNDLVYRGPPPP